jgi:outer membrane protein OmpA-like peptidoglycan-associated protein
VILLPDEDGKTGTVIVKNQGASTTLNKPYTYTDVSNTTSMAAAAPIAQNKVNNLYQSLLNSEPLKPVSFILYFEHDSINLTKDSMNLIPQVLQVAKDREPSEISVIGHTDSKGSSAYNNKLSLQRAETMAKLLKASDANLKNIYIKSHGENDPLVMTEDGVSEEKNRRVEIMIR